MKRENIVFVVPLFFFTLLIIAGLYSFPAGDDYCYSFHTNNEPDLFSRIINEYQTGNGRYISNFLVFNNPVAYEKMWMYHLAPAILLLSGLFCLYRFCRTVIICEPFTSFLIALSMLTVIVLQQPDITESIYWYTGAVTYFPAGCLAWLIFSLLPGNVSMKKTIMLCLLIILMTGFNETIMQLSIVFAVLFFLKSVIEKKLKTHHFFLIIIAIAAAATVIMSPGNSAREELFSGNQQILKSVTWPVLQSARFAGWFLLHPSVIILTIVIILFPIEKIINESIRKIKPFFYLLLIAATLYLASFAPYYFTGILGQHRTYNLSGMLFFPLYFGFLFSCAESGYFNKMRTKIFPEKLKTVLLFLTVLVIPLCYNGYYLATETAGGKLSAFYEEHLHRDKLLKEAIKTGNEDYVFPAASVKSEILGSTDTDGSKDHWVFFCAEEFYKSIEKK